MVQGNGVSDGFARQRLACLLYNCTMGDVVTLSDGTALEIVTPAAQTDGRLVEVLFTLPPGRRGPPSHLHRHVEEWEVLAGTLEARVGGKRRTLAAGASLSIPPGTAHTFRNGGDSRPGCSIDTVRRVASRNSSARRWRFPRRDCT